MIISCGDCGKKYKLPEQTTRKTFVCTGCQAVIAIPSEDVEADPWDMADDDLSPELPSRSRAETPSRALASSTSRGGVRAAGARGSLKSTSVPLGIMLVHYGLQGFALSFLMSIGVSLLAPGVILPAMGVGGLLAFRGLCSLVYLGAFGMSLTGQICCLTAPRSMPGRVLIFLAVGLQGVAILLTIVGMILGVFGDQLLLIPVFVTSLLSGMGGTICFIAFLQQVCVFRGEDDLAKTAKTVLVMTISIIVLGILVALPLPDVIRGISGLIILGLALTWLLKYSRLLRNLTKALRA